MKVFVTGAAGYIGRHVVKELLDNSHTVICNDFSYDGIDERAQISNIDIFSKDSDIYTKSGCPDLLIHLAWKDGFIHNSPAHMENLSDHIIFLRNMINGGCKNISVMGTMHEIGYWEGMIDETTPCNPLSQYGVSKNALRQSLLLLNDSVSFNLYWLRAFYIFGDDIYGSSIFSKIALAAQNGETTFPFTTGKNKYDFISVYNLSKQIVAAVTQDEITGVINVCTGNPVCLADQVEWYIKDRDFRIKLDYGVYPDRPYDSPEVFGNPSLINTILNKKGVKYE